MPIKFLSPVDKTNEIEKVIEVGANELYCGLLAADWNNKYIAASCGYPASSKAGYSNLTSGTITVGRSGKRCCIRTNIILLNTVLCYK